MSKAFTIHEQHRPHFVTFTVHQWVDVFTRKCYVDIFLASIQFAQTHKGLLVFGWVVMTNHVHLIIGSKDNKLSDIIRDVKKFTARQLVKAIETNEKESRKQWLLWLLKKDNTIWFWEDGYHGEEIRTMEFFQVKLNYIHQNPVRAGIVAKEEEYVYSSSCDFNGNRKGLLELAAI